MKGRKFLAHGTTVLSIAVLVFLLAGCATSVPIKSVRPSTIDTSNIQRMAIRPFENKSGVNSPLATQAAQYLSDKTTQEIMSSGKFDIVSPNDPNAEGIFTGEIRRIASNDTQEQRKRTTSEGVEIIETWYTRQVQIEFQYSVINTRTNMPVGFVNKQGSQSDTRMESSRLDDPVALVRRIIDSQLRQFSRDIIPTIVSTSVKLMEEKSKDKVLKDRMKAAMTLVKNNNYEGAIELFDELSSQSVYAKENARILRQAIASDIAAQTELAALMSDTSGLVEKAVDGALAAINSSMPSNSIMILMKANSAEQGMLNNAIDQLTKNVVQAGRLKIVDRQNQALISAEVEHQMSGNVSDASYVSIGQQLGAQYIVLCWIGGEMSSRRFNIRVLNIETSQVVNQSDFEI